MAAAICGGAAVVVAIGQLANFGGDVKRAADDRFGAQAVFQRNFTQLRRSDVGRMSEQQFTNSQKLVTVSRERLDRQAAFVHEVGALTAPDELAGSLTQYRSAVAELNKFGYDRIARLTDRSAYLGQAYFETFFHDSQTTKALAQKAERAARDMKVPECDNPTLFWPVRG